MSKKQRNDTLRKQKAQDTKDRLFEAAFDLLMENDVEDISIRMITSSAGVSIGTFYTYFESKIDVFYQTYSKADRYFDSSVRKNLIQESSIDQILYFFDCYADYNANISGMKIVRILFTANNKFFNRKEDFGMQATLKGIIERGQAMGEFKNSITSEELTEYLMISARGLVYNWATTDGAYNLKERMINYCKMWIAFFLT